jgi:hypothetical protein
MEREVPIVSQSQTYKNIRATVRTPRCAILINENSALWKTAVTGAITCASEVWGGRHFLLIPTDGVRIKDKFWEILEAYSPDHLGVYRLSYADMEEADSAKYAATRQHYYDAWQKQGFTNGFDAWFEKQVELSPVDELAISEELEAQLIARLSPFHFQDKAVLQHISYGSGFGFPFTKISDIISLTTRHIGQITLPKKIDDPDAALIVHSYTGLASSTFRGALRDQGFSTFELPANYQTSDFLERVLGRRGIMHGSADPGNWTPPSDYMNSTPFAVSMLHLGSYYDMRMHLDYKEPIVVIAGDTVDDFCLYYSLSRLHNGVFWLPLAWLRSCHRASMVNSRLFKAGQPMRDFSEEHRFTFNMISIFFERIEHGRGEKRIELRSMSLNPRQVAVCRKQMIDCCPVDASTFAGKIDSVAIGQTSTRCILRVFEEDNYSNNEPIVFLGKDAVTPFPTPRPKNFTEVRPYGHFWITSLDVEGYVLPPLPTLGPDVVSIHDSSTESRIASDGIAYHCPNVSYFGQGLDALLVRPKLHLPSVLELLGVYFSSIGIRIQYSDKGNYFLDTLDRFGGLDDTGKFIKARRTRQILDKFMSTKNDKNGNVIFLRNDQRAYLNFEAIRACVGEKLQAAELIDLLIGRHVLERGYIMHCERCRLSSWYNLDGLTTDFVCNRCSFRQQFTLSHWKHPVEPHWYYRLAETVYQFYLHNSHLTAQVLYKLKDQAKSSFEYVPEIELLNFPDPGKKRELDIACIIDGKIVLGEGKTEALRPRDVGKFELLTERLGKRPDEIVFATNLRSVSRDFRVCIGELPGSRVLLFPDLYDR